MSLKHLFNKLRLKLHIYRIRRFWKKANLHNQTWLGDGNYTDSYFARLAAGDLIHIGNHTYGAINAYSSGNPQEQLHIGSFCSVASSARFMLSGGHALNTVSTYPFRVKILGESTEALCKGAIVLEDDVWVGDGALVLSGVHIGQGAVIAAGSVVAKDVPPYAIVGGVPAKVIKYRFAPEMIEELLRIDYSRLDDEAIRQQEAALYTPLTDPAQLSWLPKK